MILRIKLTHVQCPKASVVTVGPDDVPRLGPGPATMTSDGVRFVTPPDVHGEEYACEQCGQRVLVAFEAHDGRMDINNAGVPMESRRSPGPRRRGKE